MSAAVQPLNLSQSLPTVGSQCLISGWGSVSSSKRMDMPLSLRISHHLPSLLLFSLHLFLHLLFFPSPFLLLLPPSLPSFLFLLPPLLLFLLLFFFLFPPLPSPFLLFFFLLSSFSFSSPLHPILLLLFSLPASPLGCVSSQPSLRFSERPCLKVIIQVLLWPLYIHTQLCIPTRVHITHTNTQKIQGRVWWCKSLIPGCGKQRRADL